MLILPTATATSPGELSARLLQARLDRNLIMWEILTRAWEGYRSLPKGMPEELWWQIASRFTITDLLTPVLTTITSAAYGGRIKRNIKKARNKKALKAFMKSADYERFMVRFFTEAIAYGTAYAHPGYDRKGKPSLSLLPVISTEVITPEDDARDIQEVRVQYSNFTRAYTEKGIYDRHKGTLHVTSHPTSNFGFVPIVIGRGRHLDCSTPYGESVCWPAAEETIQVTYLMNDLMVLERTQAYSTLVLKGNVLKSQKDLVMGPFTMLRLDSSDPNASASYITPAAAIEKIDEIIDSKFRRCAVQCGVPVELFQGAKSGTNQSSTSALLTHKPLFDLITQLQRSWVETEIELLSMIDAMLTWQAEGGIPLDLDLHREDFQAEIEFIGEMNPLMTQTEVQSYVMATEAYLYDHKKAVKHFDPDVTDAEVQEMHQLWLDERKVATFEPELKDEIDELSEPEELPTPDETIPDDDAA